MADVPSVAKYIQVEETQFRGPTSESMLQKIGGSLNYILDNMDFFAVGSVLASKMTLVQFQSAMGTGWVLADGSAPPALSKYEAITGFTLVPDLRGVFPRGNNNGKVANFSAEIWADPDGARNVDPSALTSYQLDALGLHGHNISWNNTENAYFASLRTSVGDVSYPHVDMAPGSEESSAEGTPYPHPPTMTASGTSETRPGYVVFNWFVRVN